MLLAHSSEFRRHNQKVFNDVDRLRAKQGKPGPLNHGNVKKPAKATHLPRTQAWVHQTNLSVFVTKSAGVASLATSRFSLHLASIAKDIVGCFAQGKQSKQNFER